MPSYNASQYQAYSLATRTAPKTLQVVMLYDGAMRFLKQALAAIAENRIEDRFRLLARASEIMTGLQNSIDFEAGGEVAKVLHNFYVTMSMRILSVNFNARDAKSLCEGIIGEIKQMRDVWEEIDRNLRGDAPAKMPLIVPIGTKSPAADAQSGNITVSA